MQELTEAQIRTLAHSWLQETLTMAENERLQRDKPLTRYDIKHYMGVNDELRDAVQDDLLAHDPSRIAETAEEVLRQNGIEPDRASLSFQKLCRELLKASLRFHEEDKKRLLGLSPATVVATGPNPASPGPSTPAHPSPTPGSPALGLRVLEAVDRYVEDKIKYHEWGPRTAKQDAAKLRLFAEVLGNPFLASLSRDDMRQYQKAMYGLPSNMKKGKYASLTVKEIMGMTVDDADKMSSTTVENNFIKVKSFIKWAREYDLLPDDGIRSVLKIKKAKRDSEFRTSFSKEDLEKLFNPETFLHPPCNRSWKFWVPVISLFVGARLEEICQLYLEDIVQEDGVWCFHFHKDGLDRRLKTMESTRFAPIHPFLLHDLNLLGYIKKLQKRREKRLFPELKKRDNADTYGGAVSKWFTKYRRKVGVIEATTGKKVFHSFRNTIANWCDEHNVPEKKAARLIGHKHGTMTYGRYSNDTRPSLLYDEIISKLDLGIDLSHLKGSPFIVLKK